MKQWNEIRHKVLVEMVSKRQIRRDYRIGSETLEKILANAEPPGYRQSTPRPKTKLGEFIGVIDQILVDDRDAPAKQRHTAKRIFERLRDEHGYDGSESQVRAAVAERRLHSREVFVPLSQPPGEAQFDFGEATVIISGDRVKAALSVMTLPYSDAFDINAYPRECTETFQHSHSTGFERFGGVPTKVAYDNSSIAVKKVLLGPERELTRAFLALKSHYLFDHRCCRVARGTRRATSRTSSATDSATSLFPFPASRASKSSTSTSTTPAPGTSSEVCGANTVPSSSASPRTEPPCSPSQLRPSRRGASSSAGRARSASCASTATTTRSRPPTPITS